MSPAMKRKRNANGSEINKKEDENVTTFDESFELVSRGERQDLTYKVSINGTTEVHHSAIRAAFHQAVLDHTSSESSDISSHTKVDDEHTSKKSSHIPSYSKLDDALPLRLPEKPRTAAGTALPVEIINTILGHLKSDGQIHSLTAFQACSRYTYQLARPIIYSEMIVSLYGLRKIRMFMHLPTANLAHRWQRAYGNKTEERIIIDEFPSVSTADRDLARQATRDLDEGQGDLWFALDGSKRLRYNLREVEKMRIVEVCPSRTSNFRSSYGQPAQLPREYEALSSCMGEDWLPPYYNPAPDAPLERPFYRMRELYIEAEALRQAHPTHSVYARDVTRRQLRDDYREDTGSFEAMAMLPLRSLAVDASLAVLCVTLPAFFDQRHNDNWHSYNHPELWTYMRQLGEKCDRFEMSNVSTCCYNQFMIPRAAKHLIFSIDCRRSGLRTLVAGLTSMYERVLEHIIEGQVDDMELPQTMLWRVLDSNVSSEPTRYNLQEYHDQHTGDEVPIYMTDHTLTRFNRFIDDTIMHETQLNEEADDGDFDDDDDASSS